MTLPLETGLTAVRFDILTIFPRMFDSVLQETIIKRAQEKGLIVCHLHDIRDHAPGRHRCVDDTPYGGGAGMVMMPGPLMEAVEAVPREGKSLRLLLSPQGERFSQRMARELASYDQIILVCGRYEGIDERARELVAEREISVGDYVLSGGEIPAMIVLDALTRLVPGVLGNEESAVHESFEKGLLEHPHFTRPEMFRGRSVPPVLLSGNHAQIVRWRHAQSLLRTRDRRPDLLENIDLSEDEREILAQGEIQSVDKPERNQ